MNSAQKTLSARKALLNTNFFFPYLAKGTKWARTATAAPSKKIGVCVCYYQPDLTAIRTYFTRWLIRTNSYDLTRTNSYDFC